jgi:radical SAM protein with 4Fe4S-binding SPASM domain
MAAAPIPEITLREFFGRLEPQRNRVPLEGILETTYRCNLACVHCYVNQPAADREARARELGLERLCRLVDEIVEAGCWHVLLTGGEVLVRSDFEPLYLYCLRQGLRVTVFTNGTEVTERIADLFESYPPHAVEISLYGATRETYERVTRVPGSFDKCLRGIRLLHARGVKLKLKTMALAWNVHEVEAMRAFASERGLPFHHDSLLNPRVDCGANRNSELQLDAERAVALDQADTAEFARLVAHAREVVKPRPDIDEDQPVYTCGAGVTGFTVDPTGALQLCQLSRKHSYDLRDGTFAEGWSSVFPALRARTWQTNAACRRCSLIGLCGNCPGAAELEHGDPEAQVAAFCEITHLRAWAALGEVEGHRRDATCCLGAGNLEARPAGARVQAGGCGSCGHAPASPEGAPAPILIRELRVARRSPA